MRQVVAVVLLLCSFTFAKGPHSSHSSRPHGSKPKAVRVKAPKAQKTVHVRRHTRKDGIYVAPYHRSAPRKLQKSRAGSGYLKRPAQMLYANTTENYEIRLLYNVSST
jgi:hypothetical protein